MVTPDDIISFLIPQKDSFAVWKASLVSEGRGCSDFTFLLLFWVLRVRKANRMWALPIRELI